ncbi:MAG: hypothetical protein Q7S37_05030 [bacterium]|nr:hypothetical protein [bacterium]
MNYQKYTWYNRNAKLDNPETIHQVLSFGKIDEIKKMEHMLGLEQITQVYLKYPKNIYSRPVFAFINKYILKNKEPIDERKYLKNTSRNLE